jgi:hypothetical protein
MSSNPLSSSSESGTNRAKFCDKAHASAAGRTKVFLACQPNDLRAGFDGLTAKVQQTISARSGFGDRGSACASVSFASGSATTIGAQGRRPGVFGGTEGSNPALSSSRSSANLISSPCVRRRFKWIGSELNFHPIDDLRTRGSRSGPFPWSVALQGSYTMTPRAARKI